MDYKINGINAEGVVSVTFSSKTVTVPTGRTTHLISGVPLESDESVLSFLNDYARTFAEGLVEEKDKASQSTGLPTEVIALVNKTQSVDLSPPVATEPVV